MGRKKWITCMLLVVVVAAPRAHAGSLGDAVDDMSPEALAALAFAPPETLLWIARASHAAAAWKEGTVTADDAAAVAADAISALARPGTLRGPEPTRAILAWLSGRVIGGDAWALLEATGDPGGPLAAAIAGWLGRSGQGLTRSTFGDCLRSFQRCLDGCWAAESWHEWPPCNEDCQHELDDCMDPGDPDLIGLPRSEPGSGLR